MLQEFVALYFSGLKNNATHYQLETEITAIQEQTQTSSATKKAISKKVIYGNSSYWFDYSLDNLLEKINLVEPIIHVD